MPLLFLDNCAIINNQIRARYPVLIGIAPARVSVYKEIRNEHKTEAVI